MKDVKKAAKNELKEFERAARELPADYAGITMVHLLEITQAMYTQGKYELVSGICGAAVKNIRLQQNLKSGTSTRTLPVAGSCTIPASCHVTGRI